MAKNENQPPVTVRLLQDPGKEANLNAFVVDTYGKIIEAVPFKGKEATLKSTQDALSGDSKVYIAQAIPKEIADKANERMLLKAGAYEAVRNFAGNFIDVYKIPTGILTRPWFWNNCLITGHLNKDFIIDGQVRNQPVCNARVHICEVETELIWPYIPIYKRRIPDWVINEIGEKFKHIHEIIVIPPIPDPIGPVSHMKRNVALSSLTNTSSLTNSSSTINNRLRESVKIQSLPPMQDQVLSAMTSGSIATIRRAMVNYHEILYPYFCLWPIYWPYIYTCDEETIVYTDCNGHFEMWENTLTEDGPLNIYIWVEVWINGHWVTVYRPPIPCYTWWNYACGTDINIRLTDSRVNPCDCSIDGGPADAVWFRSIGQSASALHIEQNKFSTIILQGATLKNGGCTDLIEGQKISPFGSGLALKIFCGANIFNAGVTHYRWKTTMLTDANQGSVSRSPAFITGNVSRPYLVKMSTTHYETHVCSLGNEGSNIDPAYRIPHHNVTAEPVGSLQDPLDGGRQPEWTDIFFDSAYIDSHSLTDGVYQFELELLKKAGSSFVVVPVAKPTYQVSEFNSIGNNQDAPNDYLTINGAGKAISYKMNVRIDNAACVGDIHDAELVLVPGPNVFSGPCGFIHYTDTAQDVKISFEASHPRNFARFVFGIVKGNNTAPQPTGVNQSGYVLSSIVGGYSLSGVVFSENFTVLFLLSGCKGQAAFSENLHVLALATDGTHRLEGFDYQYHDFITNTDINVNYDAYDVNAFALSNT